MNDTLRAELDTARTIGYTQESLRRVLAQIRLAMHYAEVILSNPAVDHEHVRDFMREGVLHDMNLVGLEREASTLACTMEQAAKRRGK